MGGLGTSNDSSTSSLSESNESTPGLESNWQVVGQCRVRDGGGLTDVYKKSIILFITQTACLSFPKFLVNLGLAFQGETGCLQCWFANSLQFNISGGSRLESFILASPYRWFLEAGLVIIRKGSRSNPQFTLSGRCTPPTMKLAFPAALPLVNSSSRLEISAFRSKKELALTPLAFDFVLGAI